MPNISTKLGTLDLSAYVRVGQNQGLDLGDGTMVQPAFSDSPMFEGQILSGVNVQNKQFKIPLFLHPATPPYTQDALNQLVAQINQAMRPLIDLGLPLVFSWQNAQASNPTFWGVTFGRFEPAFEFRQTEKGWLAGTLNLWVQPYGSTGTERTAGSYAAPANVSGMVVQPASMIAGAGSIIGDRSPMFDLRVTVGSYLADDGRIGIMAALPVATYTPIIPVGSFIGLSPSAVVQGASGAWASQYLALDAQSPAGASGGPGFFSFALSPASVYAGDNRVLGLARARFTPFGLRAFDQQGVPLGATVVASAMDGWQLVDYGILRLPPWMATAIVNVQAYAGIDPSASGMFAPRRAAPAWTKEHGPIFVVPNNSTIFGLDFNSPVLAMDGFDGASGAALGIDQTGNSWHSLNASLSASPIYMGNSRLTCIGTQGMIQYIGSPIAADFEVEMVVTYLNASTLHYETGLINASAPGGPMVPRVDLLGANANARFVLTGGFGTPASVGIPSFLPGQYHMKLFSKGSALTGMLWGPSGAYPGSASGIALVATQGQAWQAIGSQLYAGMAAGANAEATPYVESFRARSLASQGYQSRDILHLLQYQNQFTRMTPSAVDVTDLQARQRGPIMAPQLPVPSLGAGLFVASFPWDQGPANDVLNVDVRVRENFTYAR